MITFKKHILDNGLKVILHQDKSSPLVAVNILYNVGSKDEDPNQTGLAHLFEHLMFSGSINVQDFDTPIQNAGGENNAFTNADMTCFYSILPAENLDTTLWLESDRMMQLAFKQDLLDVQKKVVVEEFKETCMNVPYGDSWHKILKSSYDTHPYRWPTIGSHYSHIENVTLSDIESFFYTHYHPGNAIICVSGNIEYAEVLEKINLWFGPIPKSISTEKTYSKDNKFKTKKTQIVRSNVPEKAVYLSFNMVDRNDKDYYTYDILSDILSSGKSSRFHKNIIKKSKCFTTVDAYISGSMDPGLFLADGKLKPNANYQSGLDLMWSEFNDLKSNEVPHQELEKVKNKAISSIEYSELSILNKAINLSVFEQINDANLINTQRESYLNITADDIKRIANMCFTEDDYSEIIYLPENA